MARGQGNTACNELFRAFSLRFFFPCSSVIDLWQLTALTVSMRDPCGKPPPKAEVEHRSDLSGMANRAVPGGDAGALGVLAESMQPGVL